MRREPTPAEDRLWQRLRGGQLNGFKFRRQHAIERFVVDFYCSAARLVIEVDGAVHQHTRAADAARQELLQALGLFVLRFNNTQTEDDIESVLQAIADLLTCSATPSPFAERGSGVR